jgi:hypothetical protein
MLKPDCAEDSNLPVCLIAASCLQHLASKLVVKQGGRAPNPIQCMAASSCKACTCGGSTCQPVVLLCLSATLCMIPTPILACSQKLVGGQWNERETSTNPDWDEHNSTVKGTLNSAVAESRLLFKPCGSRRHHQGRGTCVKTSLVNHVPRPCPH